MPTPHLWGEFRPIRRKYCRLATGAKVWEFEAGGPLSASPAIAAGRLVIGTQDGKLYCLG